MNFHLTLLFSFSVAIAAIIGWVRFRRIAPAFYPFLYLLWLGLLNEILSGVLGYNHYDTTINNNLFSILEALILLWFFRRQQVFIHHAWLPFILGAIYLVIWCTEILLTSIHSFNSYFVIFFSFVTSLLSIHMINRVLLTSSGKLIKNPVFILGLAFIIYYTYSVLVEIFWHYGQKESTAFRNELYHILVYLNLGINLVYALAVLWMPARQRFTLI